MIKFIKNILFTGFLIAISALSVKADHMQYLFQQGNEFYQQKKYEEAIKRYQEILENGYENWQLYYNLGNAYFKTEQFGRAILNYERALKLNPRHEDLQFNLELANLRVVDNIVVPEEFVLFKIIEVIKNFYGIETLTWLAIAFYLGFISLIILRLLVRNLRLQKILKPLLITVTTVWILVSAVFLIRIHEEKTVHHGILLEPKVIVSGGPSPDGTELFPLHEGVKFKIEEMSGDWAKIRLADGKVGWIERNTFEII